MPVATIRSRPTPARSLVMICGKCARKLDGGYGPKGKERLKTTLRQALRDAGHRRDVRVVETRCLGVCPKQATTMIMSGRPHEMLVVPAGAPTEEIMRHVLDPTG